MNWIKVSQQLPPFGETILSYTRYGDIACMVFHKDDLGDLYWVQDVDVCIDCIDHLPKDYVTHWIPLESLPCIPIEDEEDQIVKNIKDNHCPSGKSGCLVAHSNQTVEEALKEYEK